MLKDENGFPRRNRLDLCEKAEKAIYEASHEVEKLGADTRLTEAIIKLAEARELVSDYIDEKKTNEASTSEDNTDDGTGGNHPPNPPSKP